MTSLNFSIGDKVRLRLATGEQDGTILEASEKDIILLKLESGYNVGIKKEKILASRVLKKFIKEEKKVELPKSRKEFKNTEIGKLPSIGLVITGGTIASKLDSKTGGVKWLTNVEEFSKFYPGIFDIVNVKKIEIPFMVASESMSWEHWKGIAESVEKLLNDQEISGVIVTHGTDFLGYTGAALSFFLGDLGKPVVLTYSQRSIDRASSDANLNLQCAARTVVSDLSGVFLVGHGTISDDYCFVLKGTKTRKMHSSRRDTFQAINDKPIAKVWPDRIEFLERHKKREENKKIELDTHYNEKVGLVKFYPGQDPTILDYYALKYKGIIIEASGLGHLPVFESKNSWIPKLKKHIKDGFVICATTQCINGRTDPLVYSNGRELLEAGVIFLEDMLAETAFVKLGWVLGHYGWKGKVEEKMLENISGEFNEGLGLSGLK
jgi:glutamyl-tRNA(Gln) amidotransferase subunit D